MSEDIFKCFALEYNGFKAKHLRSVFSQVLRLDFVEIHLLLKTIRETFMRCFDSSEMPTNWLGFDFFPAS